jgi:CBS domain-containing protein
MASPVVTVAPGTALKEVASLLVERRINAVPVVDAGDRLIGIVSEADLLSLETGGGPARGDQSHTNNLKL